MDNFVRNVRLALQMSQADFARAIGRSTQSVQGYEHGRTPPADVLQKIEEIVAERGEFKLVSGFSDADFLRDLEAGKSQGKTGSIAALPTDPYPYDRRNKAYHDMLENVLNSGDTQAIQAVQPNLILFNAWVKDKAERAAARVSQSPQSSTKKPAKRGA